MSVSDPFIKDIKGCVQQFLKQPQPITDNYFYLILFCTTIEKIFNIGLKTQQNPALAYLMNISKEFDVFEWMASLPAKNKQSDLIPFAYKSSVDHVKERKDLASNLARFRLLIKYCLAKKCLHVPVEFLVRTKSAGIFYKDNSIIGDEILIEILLSVLYQISKINFAFDLNSSSFLDCSWYIPDLVHVELVPCRSLGLGISFSGERAVIVSIDPNSVASENPKIKVGDVLDKLNNAHINLSTKGRLSAIVRSNKYCPKKLTIVKAYNAERKEFFSPIKAHLKQLHIDLESVVRQYETEASCGHPNELKKFGYEVMYLGCVNVGPNGSVKYVNKAMKKMLVAHFSERKKLECDDEGLEIILKIKQPVTVEIGEMGVKVRDFLTEDLVLDHSYMQISSCGGVTQLLKHWGYIAGEENCDIAENFNCYIFEAKTEDDAESILQSIGQGFRRTHFAV